MLSVGILQLSVGTLQLPAPRSLFNRRRRCMWLAQSVLGRTLLLSSLSPSPGEAMIEWQSFQR